VTVGSGEDRALTFVNTTQKGLLKFRKVIEGTDTALPGAQFALLKDGVPAATGTSDQNGYVYILADPGTYTLRETQTPGIEYLKAADQPVVIENARTTILEDVEDPIAKGRLIVSKYVVSAKSNCPASEKVLIDQDGGNAPAGVLRVGLPFTLRCRILTTPPIPTPPPIRSASMARRFSITWTGSTEAAIQSSTR
jgi:hypothetical protein